MFDVEHPFYAPHFEPPDPALSMLAWLRAVRRNMLAIIPAASYDRPVVSQRIGPFRWHILSGPAAFSHVFRDNLAAYPKAPIMHRMLSPYLGRGLLLADGHDWNWQRRTLAHSLGGGALATMIPAMIRVAGQTAQRLGRAADQGQEIAFAAEMRMMATDMVRHTMFGDTAAMTVDSCLQGPDPDALGAYRQSIQHDLDRFLHRFGTPGLFDLLNLPQWLLHPTRLFRRSPVDHPREVLKAIVTARRNAKRSNGDLMDLMLGAADPETGRRMTDGEIRDNLMTFIIAGSDTSALTLTWSLYLLDRMPGMAARLRREADEAFAGAPDPRHVIGQLGYTRQFLDEVLRLFPPAPLLIRRANRDDDICGTRVRRGDMILAPIYALHRNPAVWDDPHRFDPNRFAPGAAQVRYSYLPFGAGARACIGRGFALAEAQITLATLVRHFDVKVKQGWQVKPLMMLTLKPDGGLPVFLTCRRDGQRTGQPSDTTQSLPRCSGRQSQAPLTCSATNAAI